MGHVAPLGPPKPARMVAVADLGAGTNRVSVSVAPENYEGMDDLYRPDLVTQACATTIDGGLVQAKAWLIEQGWKVGSWHKHVTDAMKRWAIVEREKELT